MKTLTLILVALVVGLGNTGNENVLAYERTDSSVLAPSGLMKSGTYEVIAANSKLNWTGKKPNGEHHGTVSISNGFFEIAEGHMISGKFSIDMTTIAVTYIKSESMNGKLVGHLKSEDFFHAEMHPSAHFVLAEGLFREGTGDEAGYYDVKGTLTVKDISHRIAFKAWVDMTTMSIKTDEIVLDRTKWDVKYNSKTVFAELKDNFIHDEMYLQVDLRVQ